MEIVLSIPMKILLSHVSKKLQFYPTFQIVHFWDGLISKSTKRST